MKTLPRIPAGRLAVMLLVAAMVVCAWLAPLEATANRQIDAGLKRALVSFAAARARLRALQRRLVYLYLRRRMQPPRPPV